MITFSPPTTPFRIGILGPESTGKSTLCMQLAEVLGATYVPEYAREYIYSLDMQYGYDEVCHVAEQNRLEWEKAEGIVVYDTEILLTRVWLDDMFGHHPEWMNEPPLCDIYLLTSPDIAAVPEPIRTNASDEQRQHYFEVYRQVIERTGRPYAIVSGQGEERLLCARQAVVRLIQTTPNV